MLQIDLTMVQGAIAIMQMGSGSSDDIAKNPWDTTSNVIDDALNESNKHLDTRVSEYDNVQGDSFLK